MGPASISAPVRDHLVACGHARPAAHALRRGVFPVGDHARPGHPRWSPRPGHTARVAFPRRVLAAAQALPPRRPVRRRAVPRGPPADASVPGVGPTAGRRRRAPPCDPSRRLRGVGPRHQAPLAGSGRLRCPHRPLAFPIFLSPDRLSRLISPPPPPLMSPRLSLSTQVQMVLVELVEQTRPFCSSAARPSPSVCWLGVGWRVRTVSPVLGSGALG